MSDVEMSHSVFGGLMGKLQEKDDQIAKLEKELREARERIKKLESVIEEDRHGNVSKGMFE